MSKKKAVGTTHLAVDIPTGRGAKIKTIGEADLLARDIIELGRRLNIDSHCIVTYGEQPVGFTIGPLLEAREALEVLMNKTDVQDLVDKACHLAGAIFEMVGKSNGYSLAKEILVSGKAEKKLREIISLQGGNSNVQPSDLAPGQYKLHVRAKRPGRVLWMDNSTLVAIARAAGAPKDKGSGIIFRKKTGSLVKEREILFTIYAERSRKLSRSEEILDTQNPVGVGDRMEMFIHRIKETPVVKRAFVLER
jgi:AMP phosphorylase